MKTLQEKYNAVLEGNFPKSQFVRDAKMEVPRFISPFNGFEDTVQILKNKGMLVEAKAKTPEYDKPAPGYPLEALERGVDYELEKMGLMSNETVSEEDYAKAKEIADLRSYGEINYASELERILKEHAKEQEGKSEEDYETLTLEEALSKIPSDRDINLDSLKAFITERIDQEFKQFNKDINNEFYRVEEDGSVYLDLPRFISTGLKRNENSTGSEAAFENANQKLNLTNNRTHNLKQIFILN